MSRYTYLLAGLLLAGCGQWPVVSDVPNQTVEFQAAMGPRFSAAKRFVLNHLTSPSELGFDRVSEFQIELVAEWDSFEFHCVATQGNRNYFVEGTLVDAFKPQVFIHQKRLID